MRRANQGAALALAALVWACTSNTAPGNDRRSELDTPEPAAEHVDAASAIEGVDTGLLKPEPMTDADFASLPSMTGACTFRFTEVGLPVVVYGPRAFVKLNGKLVELPSAGEERFAAGGIDITVVPIEERPGAGDEFDAQFVIMTPGMSHELGFHGVAEC